ncbi:MAG: P-loop NTPase, partial [Eubacteriales bacterium]|nr:P-loop NTPase [Eubacteriales bacterium]
PDCGKEHSVFGESHVGEIAKEHDVELLARMPIDPKISKACDRGLIELFENDWLDKIPGILEKDM